MKFLILIFLLVNIAICNAQYAERPIESITCYVEVSGENNKIDSSIISSIRVEIEDIVSKYYNLIPLTWLSTWRQILKNNHVDDKAINDMIYSSNADIAILIEITITPENKYRLNTQIARTKKSTYRSFLTEIETKYNGTNVRKQILQEEWEPAFTNIVSPKTLNRYDVLATSSDTTINSEVHLDSTITHVNLNEGAGVAVYSENKFIGFHRNSFQMDSTTKNIYFIDSLGTFFKKDMNIFELDSTFFENRQTNDLGGNHLEKTIELIKKQDDYLKIQLLNKVKLPNTPTAIMLSQQYLYTYFKNGENRKLNKYSLETEAFFSATNDIKLREYEVVNNEIFARLSWEQNHLWNLKQFDIKFPVNDANFSESDNNELFIYSSSGYFYKRDIYSGDQLAEGQIEIITKKKGEISGLKADLKGNLVFILDNTKMVVYDISNKCSIWVHEFNSNIKSFDLYRGLLVILFENGEIESYIYSYSILPIIGIIESVNNTRGEIVIRKLNTTNLFCKDFSVYSFTDFLKRGRFISSGFVNEASVISENNRTILAEVKGQIKCTRGDFLMLPGRADLNIINPEGAISNNFHTWLNDYYYGYGEKYISGLQTGNSKILYYNPNKSIVNEQWIEIEDTRLDTIYDIFLNNKKSTILVKTIPNSFIYVNGEKKKFGNYDITDCRPGREINIRIKKLGYVTKRKTIFTGVSDTTLVFDDINYSNIFNYSSVQMNSVRGFYCEGFDYDLSTKEYLPIQDTVNRAFINLIYSCQINFYKNISLLFTTDFGYKNSLLTYCQRDKTLPFGTLTAELLEGYENKLHIGIGYRRSYATSNLRTHYYLKFPDIERRTYYDTISPGHYVHASIMLRPYGSAFIRLSYDQLFSGHKVGSQIKIDNEKISNYPLYYNNTVKPSFGCRYRFDITLPLFSDNPDEISYIRKWDINAALIFNFSFDGQYNKYSLGKDFLFKYSFGLGFIKFFNPIP